jgi:hypothetical protein
MEKNTYKASSSFNKGWGLSLALYFICQGKEELVPGAYIRSPRRWGLGHSAWLLSDSKWVMITALRSIILFKLNVISRYSFLLLNAIYSNYFKLCKS